MLIDSISRRYAEASAMKSIINVLSLKVIVIFLLLLTAPCTPAQEVDGNEGRECEPAVGAERLPCESETNASDITEIILEVSGQSMQFEELRLPQAQIREDLRHLHSVTSYLSMTAAQDGELNFKVVSKSASEIKKRALRLKDNLSLPNPDKSPRSKVKKGLLDARQFRPALSALSSLISDAVRNPALRGYLLDMRRSAKARSELDEIVELSEGIKMSSEMLGRNSK
jgi:hypothetical protein